jgi:hypothetical protein
MRAKNVLIYDSIFAIAIIFAMSSCEEVYNPQKIVKASSEKIMTTAGLCKKY